MDIVDEAGEAGFHPELEIERNRRAEYGVLYGVTNKIAFLVDFGEFCRGCRPCTGLLDPVLACYFLGFYFFIFY